MAQNVTIAGVSFENVPSVDIAKTGGGFARFVDSSDANASASDIVKNKTAYVNGNKVVGTRSTGDVPDSAIIENDDGTSTYGGLLELLESAESGQTVKVVKDNIEVAYISVKSGVTLDLNGKTVTVAENAALSSGAIIDTGSGAGALKVSINALKTTAENAKYIPLYDSANSAYRFFHGELSSYGVSSKSGLKFYFRLLLDEISGYSLLANNNEHGSEIGGQIRWGSNTARQLWYIPVSDETLNQLATSGNPTNFYIGIYISDTEALGNTTIYFKPCITTKAGYESSSTDIVYEQTVTE